MRSRYLDVTGQFLITAAEALPVEVSLLTVNQRKRQIKLHTDLIGDQFDITTVGQGQLTLKGYYCSMK